MSKRNWTPGPWVARSSCVITSDDVVLAAMVLGSVIRGEPGEDYATAKLVAAAPDLYEALEYAVNQIPELATVPGVSAALAKARGES